MTQVGGRPVPARRRDLQSQQYTMVKMELVNSFVGFNAATVSETHMKLARKCIKEIPSRHARFEYVPFHMIIQWNQVRECGPCWVISVLLWLCA